MEVFYAERSMTWMGTVVVGRDSGGVECMRCERDLMHHGGEAGQEVGPLDPWGRVDGATVKRRALPGLLHITVPETPIGTGDGASNPSIG